MRLTILNAINIAIGKGYLIDKMMVFGMLVCARYVLIVLTMLAVLDVLPDSLKGNP